MNRQNWHIIRLPETILTSNPYFNAYAYDATHPLNPDAVQQALERIWAKIDDATLRDTHTMDELLGYDESGLPT